MDVVIEGDRIRFPGGSAPLADVQRLDERWDVWRGRGFLRVSLPDGAVEVPFAEDYGGLRAELRKAMPGLPFRASWARGFPAAPRGMSEGWAWVGAAAATLTAGGLGGSIDGRLGVLLALVAAATCARRVARVRLGRLGVEVGWRRIPWQDLQVVAVRTHGTWAELWLRSHDDAVEATIPAPLLPAFRARLLRLGGLEVQAWPSPDELRYRRRWALVGAWPWALALAGAVSGAVGGGLWPAVGGAGVGALAGGLLGAAITWRAEGWWAGAVWAMVALYGLGLLLMFLA